MKLQVNGSFSSWIKGLSGVPQGSVLGPLLFLIYVHDLPDWVRNSIVIFVDDTKIWTKIQTLDDKEALQQDLDRLVEWFKRWLQEFNPEKCKVMHVGHDIPTSYSMTDKGKVIQLDNTQLEKDLGIWVTNDLKPNKQCIQSTRKAQSVLGMIKRHFKVIDKEDFSAIYKTYVRLHLEYCVQAWSPHLKKDIACLEAVQRQATKMVQGMKKLSYECRLKQLHIHSLEQRRIRGHLTETFKKNTKGQRTNQC